MVKHAQPRFRVGLGTDVRGICALLLPLVLILLSGCNPVGESIECVFNLSEETNLRPSSSLYEGKVGEPFRTVILVQVNNSDPRTFEEEAEFPLPPGLTGEQTRGQWLITGTPSEAGRFPYRLRVEVTEPATTRRDGSVDRVEQCRDDLADGVYEFNIARGGALERF